jgi:hypothetical protein
MLHTVDLLLELFSSPAWLAQVANPLIDTPEAALVFSGPRFFSALIAGVVLAFGFQLLLTNLSVAAGISYLEHRSDSTDSSESGGGAVRKIGTAVGLWTLVTVSFALFIACLLAVKLSLVNNVVLGGIIGLVIWGTYFSLLVWISSTAVGSLIGSVVSAAVSGFQAIIGTASTALGAKVAKDQLISTAEAAAAAVRRELTAGLDPQSLREKLEDYLAQVRPAGLDMQKIQQEFERLLSDPELQALADPENLGHFDRSAFEKLISDRSDLSKREVSQILDQLESTWKQTVGKLQRPDAFRELVDYLRSTQPGKLIPQGVDQRLDQLLDELRKRRHAQNPSMVTQMLKQDLRTLFDDPQAGFEALGNRLSQFDRGTLVALLSSREDISKADAERIISQIERTRDSVLQRAEWVQQQVQQRLEEIKYQAQRQVEETRKAAAVAAWWLFATALTSATLSAIAGGLAVNG